MIVRTSCSVSNRETKTIGSNEVWILNNIKKEEYELSKTLRQQY